MHESLRLFDAAITLARQESEALLAEDEALLERLCAEREVLMNRAWERREGCAVTELKQKLLTVQRVQERLAAQAGAAADNLREELRQKRRQDAGLAGYRHAGRHGHGPVYLKRQS